MKLAEGFFDFLRGDNNPVSQNNSIEKESCRSWNDNEKWFLYTFSPQSSECSLNCLFVTVNSWSDFLINHCRITLEQKVMRC